ncbi:hypothetical protein ACFV23_06980 [Streptomyces sp. NPDC059627]
MAKTGLAENPGKRPTGRPKTSGSPRQNGTKGPNTGPSDTAPVDVSGTAPSQVTNPVAHQPLDNGRDRIGGGAVLQDADDPSAWPTSGRLLYPDIDTYAYNDKFDDPRSSGDCQSTRKTWVHCQPLDAQGRATGVQACLNEADINFNPNGRTKDFDPAKKTVWPEVTCWGTSSAATEATNATWCRCTTTSRPVYVNATDPLPEEIDITALGTGGFKGTWKVRNVP